MARLVLHVGAHKTGTSYVQRLFHLNRELLSRHGIIYPEIGPNQAHHILATPWIDIPEIPKSYFDKRSFGQWLQRRDRYRSFFDAFVEQHASRKGTVFLSAEVFSRAEPQHVDMVELSRLLKSFEDVRLVYMVRHQADYIQSIWLQLAKNRKAPRFDHFLAYALDQQLASGLWVNHVKVIDHILTGFSSDQLIVLDYEACRRHPEGIVGPFLDLMESPVRAGDLEPLQGEANISPDALATWLAHSMQWPSVINMALAIELRSCLNEIRERRGKKRTSLYSRDQYMMVNKAFVEENDVVGKWLQSGQSRDSMSLSPSPDALLFREDLTVSEWAGLARCVLNYRGGSASL